MVNIYLFGKTPEKLACKTMPYLDIFIIVEKAMIIFRYIITKSNKGSAN